jgi:hypothetical protein
MAQGKTLSSRVDELADRLDAIEQRLSGYAPPKGQEHPGSALHYCGVPVTPERTFDASVSNERAQLLRVISKKWVNGTVLHFYFFTDDRFGAPAAQKEVVRRGFQVWRDVGIGIQFEEVASPDDAEIRIGFLRGDGAWSYVGRDALNQGQGERTMNFGWDLTRPGEIDTAVHEIGHALGFPHEHQNPNAGIVWNENAVISALAGPPNFWSEEKTRWNILRKIPQDSVEGSRWDPDSIMHYPFEAGMIDEPTAYRDGLRPAPGLSAKDIAQVRLFYPPMQKVLPQLRPFEPQRLLLQPGEQADFGIIPEASRKYNFRTFGTSDTVMVLFQDDGGSLRYLSGDDDSGSDRNASFEVRLLKGQSYVVRIRLYYSFASGNTLLFLW